MDKEFLEKITNSIQTKLGEETASIISDDLGKLITENDNTINEINSKDSEIKTLKEKNQMLVNANGSLLQQVGFKKQEKEETKEEEKPKHFDFRNAFDEYGNFKK